jgi:NhaA family Na+:H+ antiporter
VIEPVQRFIHTQTNGAALMLGCALVAIAWANSPLAHHYHALWSRDVSLSLGFYRIADDLHHWVNDGLMTIFFFVAGLEIKREIVDGQLSDMKQGVAPVVCAAGGMLVPALIYVALTAGTAASAGWAIPVATDIAFALAALAVLGNRIASEVRVFLLAVAVADDIGAVLIIAVFYSYSVQLPALAVATALFGAVIGMRALGVRSLIPYWILGTVFWLAVRESGIHPTVAGVALGLGTPAYRLYSATQFNKTGRKLMERLRGELKRDDKQEAEATLGQFQELLLETEPPLERLERSVAPWSNYLVLPLFALANAGVTIPFGDAVSVLTSPVFIGVTLGLALGKPIGIAGTLWLASRLTPLRLPDRVGWNEICGLGLLAGIGFTMALFLTELAFGATDNAVPAKLGILTASLISMAAGVGYLLWTSSRTDQPNDVAQVAS